MSSSCDRHYINLTHSGPFLPYGYSERNDLSLVDSLLRMFFYTQQFLFPTFVNTSCVYSTSSDKSYFLFHLVFEFFLIFWTASPLSILIGKSSMSAPIISLAASLACKCISAHSLPFILLWPGTKWASITLLLSESIPRNFFICRIMSILFFVESYNNCSLAVCEYMDCSVS